MDRKETEEDGPGWIGLRTRHLAAPQEKLGEALREEEGVEAGDGEEGGLPADPGSGGDCGMVRFLVPGALLKSIVNEVDSHS
jgi:hypothetical protein